MKTNMNINALLATFPRARPPLTAEHERVYAEQYRLNRDGSRPIENLAQRLESWMHRRIANIKGEPVLELGAGTLNHLQYENPNASYDVVEPFHELFEGKQETRRVRNFYDRVADIPAGTDYSRILSVAVLEHMTNLPVEVAQSALRLRNDGVFQAGIPSEGGALWWIGWRFSTGISYRLRTGLDYGVVMRHEHVNNADEILAVVRHFFDEVTLQRFPLPMHHASFYTYLEARKPDYHRCREFIDREQQEPGCA
jgi:hypothetical protein